MKYSNSAAVSRIQMTVSRRVTYFSASQMEMHAGISITAEMKQLI